MIEITGNVDYRFHDVYTDPTSIRQLLNDTSDPAKVAEAWRHITDGGMHPYNITGEWRTRLVGATSVK